MKKPKTKLRLRPEVLSFNFTAFILIICLTIFGIVMVFSASYYYSLNTDGSPYSYLIRQTIWCLLGLAVMIFVSMIDYHFWGKISIPIVIGSVLLLLLVLTPLGVTENGATRWLGIPGVFTIMPGELAKVAAIIGTATYLTRRPNAMKSFKGALPLAGLALVYFALIYAQPNLSTALVVVGIIVFVSIMGGLKVRWLLFILALGAAGLIFGYMFNILEPHQISRLVSFTNPFADELGEGYQVVQSLLALGSGGLTGTGLGNSIQKNLYLPEPQNDFILAILGEELGFIGVVILIGVYIFFIYVGFKIALNAKDHLGMFLAGGVVGMLAIQVIINIAVVTSSMPCTGITLPFISYGGNAMVIWMFSMGILLNVSKHQREEGEEKLPFRGRTTSKQGENEFLENTRNAYKREREELLKESTLPIENRGTRK